MDETSKKLQRKAIAKVSDYQKLFATEYGKRVLYDLISVHHIMNPTFDKDPLAMAMNEGGRNVVLRILKILKTNPEKLKKLIEESDQYAASNLI